MTTVEATRYFPERRSVKVRYYRGTDSFYIEFRPAPGTATREVVGGLNVDLDTSGEVVGFEITHASKRAGPLNARRIATPRVDPSKQKAA